jgi:prepilin-type N-terminal cleavage/methylation domain-containing protein
LRLVNVRARRAAFSLIELMVTVAILGILASLALPAFDSYVRRSKTSEVSTNLNAIFKAAAAYYSRQIAVGTDTGIDRKFATGCIVPKSLRFDPPTLTNEKRPFEGTEPAWRALNFKIADYVYYSYAVVHLHDDGHCFDNAANIENVYTFIAQGDLDLDENVSVFELAAGVDGDAQLYHARGLHVVDELE